MIVFLVSTKARYTYFIFFMLACVKLVFKH